MKISLVCPSNSLAASYPNNTTSKFTIPLPHQLEFEKHQGWKVAITELSLPLTFYNLESQENDIIFHTRTGKRRILVAPGAYTSASDLVSAIQDSMKDTEGIPSSSHLAFLVERQKIYLKVNPGEKIELSPRLSKILSLPEVLSNETPEIIHFKSDSQVDPWRNFHHFFIKTNFVENSIINETLSPILGTASLTQNTFGTLLVKQFFPPDFIRIPQEHYSSIEFEIVNEVNELVRFRSGTVVIKLRVEREWEDRRLEWF